MPSTPVDVADGAESRVDPAGHEAKFRGVPHMSIGPSKGISTKGNHDKDRLCFGVPKKGAALLP